MTKKGNVFVLALIIMQKLLINHALGVVICLIFIYGTAFPPSWDFGVASAADRYVSPPGGYGTNDTSGGYTNWLGAATNIQWAVDKSANGETIWVTNGTYYLTNYIYLSKSVLLQGVNGQEMTFINGNRPAYTNRCLYIANTGAVVKGFTIMNGLETNYYTGNVGGGVYISVGTLRNCHITTNVGHWGGGIYISGAGRIYDCLISSNSAIAGGMGGGICIFGVGAIISNCVFRGNYAPYRGGGINLYNEAMANTAHTVINCTFISNRADNIGGGVYNSGANNIIRNCLFFGNDSGWIGGLMDIYASNTTIQNCTFVRNGSDGLYRSSSSNGLVENCIIVSNSYSPNALTTSIDNRTDSTVTVGTSSGNITNNPLFVNYSADNYRLNNNSPCINAGTNQDWMTNAVDLDGRMRIRYGRVDMGAYERVHGATFYRFH